MSGNCSTPPIQYETTMSVDHKTDRLLTCAVALGRILTDFDSQRRLFWRSFELYSLLRAGMLNDSERQAVLDNGCGSGVQSLLLGSLYQQVIATDVDWRVINSSANNVEKTRRLLESARLVVPHIQFVSASPGTLPLAANAVNTVFSSYVLEHVSDRAAYLRESHRVLKAGGKLLLVVPAPGAALQYMRRWFSREYRTFAPHGHYSNIVHEIFGSRYRIWRSIIESTGFKVAQIAKIRPVWGELKYRHYARYLAENRLADIFARLNRFMLCNHAYGLSCSKDEEPDHAN